MDIVEELREPDFWRPVKQGERYPQFTSFAPFKAAAEIERLRARIAELEARNAKLAGALEPFAEAIEHLHPLHPDDGETLDGFKVREFRRAWEAFSYTPPT